MQLNIYKNKHVFIYYHYYIIFYQRYWALSKLYRIWSATNPRSEIVTYCNIYIYIYIYIYMMLNPNLPQLCYISMKLQVKLMSFLKKIKTLKILVLLPLVLAFFILKMLYRFLSYSSFVSFHFSLLCFNKQYRLDIFCMYIKRSITSTFYHSIEYINQNSIHMTICSCTIIKAILMRCIRQINGSFRIIKSDCLPLLLMPGFTYHLSFLSTGQTQKL